MADSAWLRWHFLDALAYILLSGEDVMPVHAACVARQGRGLLLGGPSGAGKSTLAFACARAGWSYVCDDGATLLQGSCPPEAIGGSRRFLLRPDAATLFSGLSGFSVSVRPNGKPKLEVPVDAISGIVAARRCVITGLVFLDRRAEGGAGMRLLDRAEALARLMREMPDYGGAIRARHQQTLRELLQVPVRELRYAGVAEAVDLLEALA